jgi:hypothetical protein
MIGGVILNAAVAEGSRMRVRLLTLIMIAVTLAGCAPDIFLGWGLPRNEYCNDAGTFPGKPISGDCLDSLHDGP